MKTKNILIVGGVATALGLGYYFMFLRKKKAVVKTNLLAVKAPYSAAILAKDKISLEPADMKLTKLTDLSQLNKK